MRWDAKQTDSALPDLAPERLHGINFRLHCIEADSEGYAGSFEFPLDSANLLLYTYPFLRRSSKICSALFFCLDGVSDGVLLSCQG